MKYMPSRDTMAREIVSDPPHGLIIRERWPKIMGIGICITAQR